MYHDNMYKYLHYTVHPLSDPPSKMIFFSFLKLEGNQGVNLNATAGNLSIDTLNDINIKSRKGKVLLICRVVLLSYHQCF